MSYKILLDTPMKNPQLGFQEYAQAMKDIIENTEPRFAIGIFGGWGTGKTTLINAIEDRLNRDFVISVSFSAWRYEKEEYLLIPLLDSIREGIQKWSVSHGNYNKEIRKFTAKIGRMMKSLLAGLSLKFGVPDAFEISFEANKALENIKGNEEELLGKVPRSVYHAAFKALESSLDEFKSSIPNLRIVVFVDDLDRCLPQGALDVMEAMKLFFDFEGFIFVVGLDQTIVEKNIDIRYEQFQSKVSPELNQNGKQLNEEKIVSGKDYIKKIFQVPFSLAPVANSQIDEFLNSIIDMGNLHTDQVNDLLNRVSKHLNYLVDQSGVNPRELKRFINSYTLILMTKNYLDPDVILTIQAIGLRPEWKDIKEHLYIWREGLIAALKKYREGDEKALVNLDPELAALPSSFIKYITDDETGGRLLNVQNINDYIYSGESLRSPLGHHLVDLMQELGQFRHEVEKLNSGESITQRDLKSLASRTNHIRSLAKEFSTSFYGDYLYREIKKIDGIVSVRGTSRPSPKEELKSKLEEILDSLERARQNALELFQE